MLFSMAPAGVFTLSTSAVQSDAYATVFSASDFQSSDITVNYLAILQQIVAAGYTTPDGILCGGDYNGYTGTATDVQKIIDDTKTIYPDMADDNFIFVQGNHDDPHELLTPSGFHEFEDYVVYSLNEDDFKTSQSGRTAYDEVVQARAADIRSNLENMIAIGDTRPVFFITHVPFHHSSRSTYGDNLYAKYIVDVLNDMGQYLDIISMFGHNHSSNYDDYIGGSVNYIAKGETMRVPIPDTAQQGATGYTEETLNFTYMNCGYVGYSSNAVSSTSTNVLTTGVFEICPTSIELSRYTSSGLYTTETIERINPQTSEPYANIGSDITDAVIGCSSVIYGKVANFTEPTYTWTSDNPDVVEVLGAGKNAQLIYRGEGDATVTLTVTGSDGRSASDSVAVTVSGGTVTVIPGETYYTYDYVSAPVSGEEYVIVNSDSAGSASAMGNTITSNTFNSVSVEVLSDGSRLYVQNPASTALWTLTTYSNTSGLFTFTNSYTNTSIKAANNRRISLATGTTADFAWQYTNNNLYNSNRKEYINGSFAAASSASGALYFYQKTEHTTEDQTVITMPDYAPAITLTKVSEDVSGKKLSFYEITPGDTLMLGGAFTGFSDHAANITTTWSSSDTSVASVDNGLVTFNGSGDTTITYTVSDGTTTLSKSVNLSLSRAKKPVFSYKLTDTIADGKSYIIASTNVAGATSIMSNGVAGTDSDRLTLVGGTITTDANGDPVILSDVESIVYNAVDDGNGHLYFINDETGKYLFVNSAHMYLYDEPDLSGTYCYFGTVDGHLASKNGAGYGPHISGDGNFRTNWGDTPIKNYIYERVISDPFVTLKKNGFSVAGKSETVYSVTDSTSITLTGDYMNFGETVTTQWISSDPSVATVENGVVTFTGADGTVDITYRAADENGAEATATVTFHATTQSEPVRVFKPVTSFTPGKNYIIVNSSSIGAAYYMNKTAVNSGTRLGRTYAVIQPDESDNSVFIEIPLDSGGAGIWTAADSGTAGYVTLQNEDSGEYLSLTYVSAGYATLATAASVSTSDSDPFAFTVDASSGRVSGLDANSSGTKVVIRHSGDGNFRGGDADAGESSGVYLFEETFLEPAVHIRSMYLNIDGTVAERRDVCAWQTETLLPRPINFETENIDYTWESSNPDVATVDENGVVTYTGAGGETVITLTATSRVADMTGAYPTATATTTLKVIPNTVSGAAEGYTRYVLTDHFEAGKYYAFNVTATAGANSYPMNCYTYTSSSSGEKRLYSNPNIPILENDDNVYFECDDESIKWQCIATDTEGVFKFYNEYKGYLLLDFATGSPRFVTTSSDLSSYSTGADLISYDSTNKRVYSVDTRADGNYLSYNSAHEYRLSSAPESIYIYAAAEGSQLAIDPVAQIRVDAFGGNKDITNVLQNRYDVYSGMTERLLSYSLGLENVTVTWSSDNENVASIDDQGLVTYTGLEGFASINMTVTGTDANGVQKTVTARTTLHASPLPYTSPTEDYPEYPAEGSVRIDKSASSIAGGSNFQTTGVAEVELAVTGVPMTQPVDVVIVFDHSSSMNSQNRLANAIEDTREFALQLVHHNERNRVAIVTFDKYENDYGSLESTSPNYNTDTSSNENRIITGDGTPEGAFVGLDDAETLVSQIDSLQYNDTPGTNYDDGLMKCYNILKAAKNDPKANKNQYVIFMSDGEPYAYNRLIIDYANAAHLAWLDGNAEDSALAPYLADPATYPVAAYFNPKGENWFANAIKAPDGSAVDLPANLDGGYYEPYMTGLGATIFSIGYSSDAAGARTTAILKRMASSEDKFYFAESNLQEAYDRILDTILYAANNAVVTDKMGDDYDLQFAQSYKLGNNMETITLDPAPYIEIGTWTLNSDGTRNEYTVNEKITFVTNSSGNLTEAYSDQVGAGATNIYDAASNTINGKNVSYNLLTETFTWTIGDIDRDEVTLKYYAYLEGSAEGEREAGVYDTNEYAYLDYNNYLGNVCRQDFPIPSLGWKEAAVNYEFYLVNELGQPVNRDGVVVPFSERVLIGNRQTQEILLNSSGEIDAFQLIASQVLADGYTLYNENAQFNLSVSSGDNRSQIEIIDEGKDVVTTYYYDGAYTYNADGIVPDVKEYTNTNVAFAVLLKTGIVPDAVVIDYGLPVKISVLANDLIKGTNGTLNGISASVAEGTVLHNQSYAASRFDASASSVNLENGRAYISGDKIVYEPTNMTMSDEEVFYYEFKTGDGMYYYTTVTVIPATNIYYEDSFITFTDSGSYQWQTEGSTYTDKFQSEDRPGTFSLSQYDANNVYGRDQAYDDSVSTYSLGSARSVVVDEGSLGKEPTAEFTFCGTGFDLFSVTHADTGAVLVAVYDTDTGKRVKNYVVQTYYGYSYDNEEGKFVPNPTSTDGLYQVPIIRSRDLAYGTYRVVITPKYGWAFDMNYDKTGASYNAYKIYVDSVRIYDPAGTQPDPDSVVGEAYINDKEYIPQYMEIRDNVLTAKQFYDSTYELDESQFTKGAVFIDGISSLDSSGVSDKFLESGPNNELYLNKGQAIAFHIQSERAIEPESLQLGMKVVAGTDGGVATLLCMNSNDSAPTIVNVKGGHEMYRRLTTYIVWDQELLSQGIYKTKYPIIIINNSDCIVSLTNFKWTYSESETAAQSALELAVTSSTPKAAVMAMRSFVLSDGEDQDRVDISGVTLGWQNETVKEKETAVLEIHTDLSITAVTVDGVSVTDCSIGDDGQKIWIYRFTAAESGSYSPEVIVYDSSGKAGEPILADALTVEKLPAGEPETEPGIDPGEQEEEKLSLWQRILNLIRKFIEFWRGLF
ncbi:MAG: VWA domain-containing protein [Acutalibacteraceae bacterium]